MLPHNVEAGGLCGVVYLYHRLDLPHELGLPHIDVGNARVPVVSLHLLSGEFLVLPHVGRLLVAVGLHLRDILIPWISNILLAQDSRAIISGHILATSWDILACFFMRYFATDNLWNILVDTTENSITIIQVEMLA